MLIGIYALLESFSPHPFPRAVTGEILGWASILAASAFIVGGINLAQVNWPKIRRRERDWGYKVVLLASAVIMFVAGLPFWSKLTDREHSVSIAAAPAGSPAGKAVVVVDAPDDVSAKVAGVARPAHDFTSTPGGADTMLPALHRFEVDPGTVEVVVYRRLAGYHEVTEKLELTAGQVATVHANPSMIWGDDGRVRTWIYDHVFAPCNATMFALLAFFVASAAFRAFRARNVEAALLLGSAIIVLVARAPVGRVLSDSLPSIAQWILDIPSNGSRRAIMMGAAVGAIATGLRVILGIERSHLGSE